MKYTEYIISFLSAHEGIKMSKVGVRVTFRKKTFGDTEERENKVAVIEKSILTVMTIRFNLFSKNKPTLLQSPKYHLCLI